MPATFQPTYRHWRENSTAPETLREAADAPSERLLQCLWQHQRLRRNELQTLDGEKLRVLHPGFWNHAAGPDFLQAVIQLGNHPPQTGDIEIDLHPGGWRGHGHANNPAYGNVILHVVWAGDTTTESTPRRVVLQNSLDAPLPELRLWAGGEMGPPDSLSGQCSAPLSKLSSEALSELLQQAAVVRFQRKAEQLRARARQVGWELSLWEGLFVALGYKQNVWPMRLLAESLPRFTESAGPTSSRLDSQILFARLLGAAGLLPSELPKVDATNHAYWRSLWDIWWRERDRFADITLPDSLWKFHGLRPANHPQRRLALAAHWVANKDFVDHLESWFVQDLAIEPHAQALLEKLSVTTENFWSRHYTLRSKSTTAPQPLLGEQRTTDLAINVILPWFWARANSGKNATLEKLAERRFLEWPKAEDNSVLRLARQRLLNHARASVLKTAAEQQGLLQIVRDFCEHSNALCENCRFPKLVRELSTLTASS